MQPTAALLATVLVALPGSIVIAQQPEEVLPACESLATQHLRYGDHVISGALDIADVDGYTFDGTAGDIVHVRGRTNTNGLGLQFALFDPSFAPVGTPLACTSTAACSLGMTTPPLPVTGRYLLTVEDPGQNNIGNYHLTLERWWPVSNTPQIFPGAAARSEALWPSTDVDGFCFLGAPGTSMTLTVVGQQNGLGFGLFVLDSSGATVGSTSCGSTATCAAVLTTGGATPNLTLASADTYQVKLIENGADFSGTYLVSLQCNSFNCSTQPITPCGGPVTPTITQIAPARLTPNPIGSVASYPVVVRGTGFCTGATTAVLIGGVVVPGAYVVSATEIRMPAPTLATGVYDLTVITPGGNATLPAAVSVSESALDVSSASLSNPNAEILLHTTRATSPILVLADVVSGSTSLPGPNSCLDFFSPTLLAIAAPPGSFAGPLTPCAATASTGTWAYRPEIPAVLIGSGISIFIEAFVIHPTLPNGFQKSDKAVLVL